MKRREIQRTLGESAYVVRYDARPVIAPVAMTIAVIVAGVVATGRLQLSFCAGIAGVAIFFRRTRLVAGREAALGVGPSGIYLGPTLYRPHAQAELIPWDKVSALEFTTEETGDETYQCVVVRGLPTEQDGASGRYGPRITYRRVDGWRLDRTRLEQTVRDFSGNQG